MLAVKESRTEVVSLLLEAGAKVDLQNEVYEEVWFWESVYIMSLLTQFGYSSLMLAVKESRTEVVSLLLEAGANIHLQKVILVGECMAFLASRSEHTMTVSTTAILAYLQLALWNHKG